MLDISDETHHIWRKLSLTNPFDHCFYSSFRIFGFPEIMDIEHFQSRGPALLIICCATIINIGSKSSKFTILLNIKWSILQAFYEFIDKIVWKFLKRFCLNRTFYFLEFCRFFWPLFKRFFKKRIIWFAIHENTNRNHHFN